MKVLVSQHTPTNMAPFEMLQEKFGAEVEFHPFFVMEALSGKEFRAKKINLPDYTAVVFSSRLAIDAYFKLCEEMRFKVPETMKYFCTTEAVAMYLQKHIVYRKRKIFYGTGTPESVVALIGPKHKGEKFLIAASDGSNSGPITAVFDKAGLDYTLGTIVKAVPQDISGLDIHSYGIVVLYSPFDVASLKESFPDFEQGDIKFISFGRSVVGAMEEAGLSIALKAPPLEAPLPERPSKSASNPSNRWRPRRPIPSARPKGCAAKRTFPDCSPRGNGAFAGICATAGRTAKQRKKAPTRIPGRLSAAKAFRTGCWSPYPRNSSSAR